MSDKPGEPTLTDEELDEIVLQEAFGETVTERRRSALRAAYSLGLADGRKAQRERILGIVVGLIETTGAETFIQAIRRNKQTNRIIAAIERDGE